MQCLVFPYKLKCTRRPLGKGGTAQIQENFTFNTRCWFAHRKFGRSNECSHLFLDIDRFLSSTTSLRCTEKHGYNNKIHPSMLFLKEKRGWEAPTRRPCFDDTIKAVEWGGLCFPGIYRLASREEVSFQKSKLPWAFLPLGLAQRLAVVRVVTLPLRGEMIGNRVWFNSMQESHEPLSEARGVWQVVMWLDMAQDSVSACRCKSWAILTS